MKTEPRRSLPEPSRAPTPDVGHASAVRDLVQAPSQALDHFSRMPPPPSAKLLMEHWVTPDNKGHLSIDTQGILQTTAKKQQTSADTLNQLAKRLPHLGEIDSTLLRKVAQKIYDNRSTWSHFVDWFTKSDATLAHENFESKLLAHEASRGMFKIPNDLALNSTDKAKVMAVLRRLPPELHDEVFQRIRDADAEIRPAVIEALPQIRAELDTKATKLQAAQLLNKTLLPQGYVLYPSKADGNCLFHALAGAQAMGTSSAPQPGKELGSTPTQQKAMANVRTQLQEYMQINEHALADIPLERGGYESRDAMHRAIELTGMSPDDDGKNKWGDMRHVQVWAAMEQRPVIVHSPIFKDARGNIVPQTINTNLDGSPIKSSKPPIHLFFNGVNHWELLGAPHRH